MSFYRKTYPFSFVIRTNKMKPTLTPTNLNFYQYFKKQGKILKYENL